MAPQQNNIFPPSEFLHLLREDWCLSLWDSTSFKESNREKFSQISKPSKGRQEINDGVEF